MMSKEPFHVLRRQQFLGEKHYVEDLKATDEGIEYFRAHPSGVGSTESDKWMQSWHTVSNHYFERLCLRFTAGESIDSLRTELDLVVSAFEHYGKLLWENTQDRNEPVFQFAVLDEYCQLMQLIGLCFLLHRRDLLPRIAAMQDGEGGKSNGGADTLFEELMAYGLGPDSRFESDWLCHKKPYEPLFHGLTETTPAKGLKELDLFLKHWYKDLAGTGWHDSHKPDEQGNQGGYYGYWSFEAGAAVLLLGIEDDSSLHKYLYYPKDLVAWAREHAALTENSEKASVRLRALAGQPCPREGFWLTPAKADSRRHCKAGELMPDVGGDYGVTIWQWDDKQ
jgi:hypothetical protein